MKKSIALYLFILFFSFQSFAQGEIDDEKKIFFRNEKTWGFFIFSNGWGGNYRYGRRINAFRKFIWEIDLNYIRHPKEIKLTIDPYSASSFVYGKMNVPIELRGSVGFQRELFRKIDKGGVSVRFVYNAGPTIVLLKPIYYEVTDTSGYINIEKFSQGVNIYGRASFFKGFSEIKIDPGIFLKAAFNFEFSKKDNKVKALEVGVTASAFLNEVEIMAAQNSRYLLNIFISYRFGQIIRGAHMENVEMTEQ
ncbi:MAG: hypothetical protein ABFS35_00675 [Bacteroidota bacterium]